MTANVTRKRGGQPKADEERKRNNMTFRARDDLREQIRRSAETSGRSVSEEIEHRLEMSAAHDDRIKMEIGEDILKIAKAMSLSVTNIEDWSEKSWIEDEPTFKLFQSTTSEIIRNYRDRILDNKRLLPRGDANKMSHAEQAKFFASLGGLAPRRPPVEIVVTDED